MKTILTALIVTLFFLQMRAPIITEQEQQIKIDYQILKIEKANWFKSVIEEIKNAEGCILNPYKCPAGYATIGYGHIILPGEDYWDGISQEKAEEILINDFLKRFKYTNPNLTYNKRLAITKLIFNIGIGNYSRSKLKQLVNDNKPIDTEIIKWCKYKNNNKWVKSTHLLKARQFELNLYNS